MELASLKEIYEAYEQALNNAYEQASPYHGLLGQGSLGDPRFDPCNRAFYDKVGQWVADFAASGPSADAAYQVSRFLLEAAGTNKKARTYWYYLVCQGYVSKLVPLLSRENCADLRDRYGKAYPKRERLPIQDQLYKQLTNAAK